MHCGPPPGVIKPVASLFQRINGAARNSARMPTSSFEGFRRCRVALSCGRTAASVMAAPIVLEYRGWERF